MTRRAPAVAVPLLAIGYGLYLVRAYATGALYVYIHPIYVIPTLVTGALLLVLGAIGLVARGRQGERPPALAVAVLAVPLLVGLVVPASPLGVATAAQRGLDLAPPASADVRAVAGPPEGFTIKDWINAFHADPEPGRHAGKPARVTGFVVRDERLPDGWFLVARFVVQCCAVDAQPIALVVRPAGAAPPPAEGAWVAVEGVIEVAEVSGERRAVVAATAVAGTEAPAQPYLY